MKGIFVDIKDVSAIFGISNRQAQTRIQVMRAALSKKENQLITIREFCEHEGITLDDYYTGIKIKPAASN